MASIIPGYEYDIFISYRQKDNKHDGWVTEFVNNLKGELESTFKEEISVYFDINPHDGLLETHDVNASLKEKLKCLIFIPIISQTYCDSKSFAWQHEFVAFNQMAKEDQFGRDIKVAGGNVASRILPIKIHDLDAEDKTLLENELGGVLRAIEFIYKASGVNRPLKPNDERTENLNHIYYRDQINKVANAVKEIITAIKKFNRQDKEVPKVVSKPKTEISKNLKEKIIIGSFLILVLIALGYFFIPKLSKTPGPVEKSIAVLPFVNLSNDPEQEYFSDGMMDAILDHLFKVGDLKVIARTSSMRYKNTKLTLKEIARELGVSALLEGSVQKIGNKVRITAQLIDPKTGFHLWSETYDRNLTDIFSIQSEVAQNVALKLKATLTSKETQLIQNAQLTTNQLAYDFYLKGNDYGSKGENSLALDMYSKAIQEDSLFSAAYAQRAKVHSYIYWSRLEGWQGHVLKAKEDIKKGILLNPELPEVKLAQAICYYWLDRNYNGALKILRELKTESPNMADLYAYSAYILRRQGKLEESIIEAKRSIQLDPFSPGNISNFSQTYQLLHQYDKAIEVDRQGLSLIPDAIDFNNGIFINFLNKTGDLKAALKESGLKEEDIQYEVYYYTRQYDKLRELISKNAIIQTDQDTYQSKTYELALTYYLSGNKSLCKIYTDSTITYLKQKIIEIPDDDRFYAALGKNYAFNGNVKEAIACGKKAVNLKPLKLDALQGVRKEQDLMEIYIFTSNYDLALDKIEYLLSIPSWLSVGILMVDPVFDKLRSLARFQKIIENARK
jgi:TolB-like protein/Flp pilus assembly protein TadD